MEVLPETVTEVVKKGRGRPRKAFVLLDPTEAKKRGRPKKEFEITEVREKMKRGPKTNLTSEKNYYTQWYSSHYKGVCMTCPSCKNPNINVGKIHRHMRTDKRLNDTASNKYSVYGI